jgi:hypothetical protein
MATMTSLGHTRIIAPFNRKPRGSAAPLPIPKTAREWEQLMRLTIEAAQAKNDRRIHGLRKALADGKSERILRMMGIIHPGDLRREFPTTG